MKKYLIVILILIISMQSKSQEIHFSQFFAAPLFLSPSFAGTTPGSRVNINFRDQWPGVPGNFITSAVSYDHNFKNFNTGLGFLLTADRAGEGDLSTINAGLVYSYDVKINYKWNFRPGINFQYARRGIDVNKLFSSQEVVQADGSYTHRGSINYPTLKSIGYIDMAVSSAMFSDDAWFGVTVDHLLMPNQALSNEADSKIPVKYVGFAGYQFVNRYNKHLRRLENVSSALMFKYQGQNSQLSLGFYWTRTPITLGVWDRGIPLIKSLKEHDALVFLFGFAKNDIRVGYSYDFTLSSLVGQTGGSHEISISYLFNKVIINKEPKHRIVPCPDI